jgi:hypothetical protein
MFELQESAAKGQRNLMTGLEIALTVMLAVRWTVAMQKLCG